MLLKNIPAFLSLQAEPWWRVFYDFSSLTKSIDEGLRNSMSSFWAVTLEMVIIGVLFLLFYAVIGLFLVYAERKVCAFIQNRLGPNRIGPFGMFQTIADLVKLFLRNNGRYSLKIVQRHIRHR